MPAVSLLKLHTHWAPTTGNCYTGFMKTAQAALADLDANKVPYEIAGMLHKPKFTFLTVKA